MLISGKLGLRNALENNYALAAFNYTNLEGIKAIIEAAEEMNSPVIIQVTQGAIDYAGFEYLRDLGTGAAARSKVPVVLHLDHGKDYNYLLKAFRDGWTSLMMDASHESFENNVSIVKEVVKIASPLDVSVEAELGVIGGKEDDLEVDEAIYTEVNEAIEFAKRSNCSEKRCVHTFGLTATSSRSLLSIRLCNVSATLTPRSRSNARHFSVSGSYTAVCSPGA